MADNRAQGRGHNLRHMESSLQMLMENNRVMLIVSNLQMPMGNNLQMHMGNNKAMPTAVPQENRKLM